MYKAKGAKLFRHTNITWVSRARILYNLTLKQRNKLQRRKEVSRKWCIPVNPSSLWQEMCRSDWQNFLDKVQINCLACKNKSTIAKFSQHLVESGHSFGKYENILEVLHLNKKTQHMNTIEKLYRVIPRLTR